MNSVFDNRAVHVNHHWLTTSDIARSRMTTWSQMARDAGLEVSAARMPHRIQMDMMEKVLQEHQKTIDIVEFELSRLIECMIKPYIFILTNPKGVVLSVHAWEQLVEDLDRDNNLGVGTSFAMEHAGVNAISLSMEAMESVYIRGSEHDLEIFSNWNCLCGPIRIGEEIIGYLDMSFAESEDLILAGSMFEHILRNICVDLENLCLKVKKDQIYDKFDTYKLTPREKEVGYSWLMNHSTLRMAEELGIAEGTVRNMLKKVYLKTGVNDKGQFFRRFL
jgi:transcriptional regulator of acetoin/glycerol metabolism